jgi:hypothetical protein
MAPLPAVGIQLKECAAAPPGSRMAWHEADGASAAQPTPSCPH